MRIGYFLAREEFDPQGSGRPGVVRAPFHRAADLCLGLRASLGTAGRAHR